MFLPFSRGFSPFKNVFVVLSVCPFLRRRWSRQIPKPPWRPTPPSGRRHVWNVPKKLRNVAISSHDKVQRCNEVEEMDGLVVIRCANKSCTKTKRMSHVQNVQISGVRGCRLFFHGLKDSRRNKCLPRNRWLSWCAEVLQRSTDVDPKLSVFFRSWDLRGRCFEHVARSPSFATHIVSEFVSMWVENGRL